MTPDGNTSPPETRPSSVRPSYRKIIIFGVSVPVLVFNALLTFVVFILGWYSLTGDSATLNQEAADSARPVVALTGVCLVWLPLALLAVIAGLCILRRDKAATYQKACLWLAVVSQWTWCTTLLVLANRGVDQ